MNETFVLRIPWGSWSLDTGAWRPNPLLAKTADEQYAENKANGFDMHRPSPPRPIFRFG